jgi:hypothetical protein
MIGILTSSSTSKIGGGSKADLVMIILVIYIWNNFKQAFRMHVIRVVVTYEFVLLFAKILEQNLKSSRWQILSCRNLTTAIPVLGNFYFSHFPSGTIQFPQLTIVSFLPYLPPLVTKITFPFVRGITLKSRVYPTPFPLGTLIQAPG